MKPDKDLQWVAQLKFDLHVADLVVREPRLSVAQCEAVTAARIRVGTIGLGPAT